MSEKDAREKILESYNDVFADLLNVLLFQGERLVRENELTDAQRRSYYKTDGKIREQERDVAKYWNRNKIQIATLGIENQTLPDAKMPVRVIGYDGAAYRNQIKPRKGRKRSSIIHPVVTMVLSFNYKRRWNKKHLHLMNCFNNVPKELLPYINDYRVNLFEIPFLSREQVNMFQSDFRIVADYFVQMRENNDYIPSKETMKHVQEVLQLMSVMTQDTRFEEAYREEGSGTNMCEYLDRLEARGEKRGITIGEARGITIGEARGIRGTVATCRRLGVADEQILKEIQAEFQLKEQDALEYLKSAAQANCVYCT